MVLLMPKKGCMPDEQGQGNSQRGQENRSGRERWLIPLRSEFNDFVCALLLVLLLHFPEKHLAESSAWLVVKVHHIHMYGFIL